MDGSSAPTGPESSMGFESPHALPGTTDRRVSKDKECLSRSDHSGISAVEKASSCLSNIIDAPPSLETLEDAVKVGVDFVKDDLKLHLTMAAEKGSRDARLFLRDFDSLLDSVKTPKTIVGVVGNTGAGKSSIINALLDEERLVPTNCVRACTASPTEISYNYSDDPQERYRAEIEFLGRDEWTKELEALYGELSDARGDGAAHEGGTAYDDAETKIALAKIKAVYPEKTRDGILGSNPESLASEQTVAELLDTVGIIKKPTAEALYDSLKVFVDSKEKAKGPRKADKADESAMELWPLIKVVRLFTKASALSTGAVIVDLPGVGDSNAARAAVADGYKKNCTALWIVTPITRAVDDKTAKNLLGDTFKRQLMFDGIYSTVTLVCSKTDDISVTDAEESIPALREQLASQSRRGEHIACRKQDLSHAVNDAKNEQSVYRDSIDEADQKEAVWEDLRSRLRAGEVIFAPCSSVKRKRKDTAATVSSKRYRLRSSAIQNADDDDSDSFSCTADSDWSAGSGTGYETSSDDELAQSSANTTPRPLTERDVDAHLAEIRKEKRDFRERKRAADMALAKKEADLRELRKEEKAVNAQMRKVCIKARNEYSRQAIKSDFAAGIKELDQQAAIEMDDRTFDPGEDLRNYEEVAESLPVFCVSSIAYQKLSGRRKKDGSQEAGFETKEDTEIPQLQAHVRHTTHDGRRNASCCFLDSLARLVTLVRLWALTDVTVPGLSEDEAKLEATCVAQEVGDARALAQKAISKCVTTFELFLEERVYHTMNSTIPRAVDAAVPQAVSWGKSRQQGGLHWSSYKATCRRGGHWEHDFNADLFEPVSRMLAPDWERAFQRLLPKLMRQAVDEVQQSLRELQQAMMARVQARFGRDEMKLCLMRHLNEGERRRLLAAPESMKALVGNLHKEANRAFKPIIQEAMMAAYSKCSDERGTGCYARIKDHMIKHIEVVRHTMFRAATDKVRDLLGQLCKRVEDEFGKLIGGIIHESAAGYRNALVGWDADMVEGERHSRQQIDKVLQNFDAEIAGLREMSGKGGKGGKSGKKWAE